jgi:hypothetical protein
MRRFWLFLLLVCAFTGLHAQTFNLPAGGNSIVSLDGQWRFHTGDNPAWANPAFDDSQWPLIRSDESWTTQGYPDYGGYAWYRFKLHVSDGNAPLTLFLARILTGYQVYANGKLIGSVGSTGPTPDPPGVEAQSFQLPSGVAGPQTIQIAIRVWNYQAFASWLGGGIVSSGSVAGNPRLVTEQLDSARYERYLWAINEYAYCQLTIVVGLTVLGLFLFRREDREYLWFAILLLSLAAESVLHIALNESSIPFTLCRFLGETAGGLCLVSALVFFSIVLRARRSLVWWMACIAGAASPLTVALFFFNWTTIGTAYSVLLCCSLPPYLWIIVALAVGAIRKDANARLLLAPVALFYGFDILDLARFITWELGGSSHPKWSAILDYPLLSHPFVLDGESVIAYIFVLALLIFLVRRFALARQEETRLSNEMEAARNMQSLLIPPTPPATPGFTVESVYIPASEVGGDFFQVLPANDDSLLIVVGDVSGKGLKAAMTVSAIIGALRNETDRQPAQVLAHLNRVLHGQITGFATCTAALITADGAMTLANAGNLAPYRNGEELAVDPGLPLGITPDVSYSESTFQLNPDDRLTFVSDGVVEATSEKRELFGFERTQAISTQSSQAIAEAARQFGQQDDISVLSVTLVPAPEPAIV